jgi:hypothetical protein
VAESHEHESATGRSYARTAAAVLVLMKVIASREPTSPECPNGYYRTDGFVFGGEFPGLTFPFPQTIPHFSIRPGLSKLSAALSDIPATSR